MEFQCQKQAIDNLKNLQEADRHSIVVSGCGGSGKTYIVKEWAKMLGINDVAVVNPTVSELKLVIDTLIDTHAPAVMCIENLDEGVVQAAYPLLKFLEECPEYLYVAVTCTNIRNIPDTILSRCILVDIAMPTSSDLEQFATSINFEKFHDIEDKKIWKCAKSFKDVKTVLDLDTNKLAYFESLSDIISFKDTVSNLSWKLQHYTDNSEAPVVIVVRYLMQILKPSQVEPCLDCLSDLQHNRISTNAIISKLIFELKYTE